MRLLLVADKYNAKYYGQARSCLDGHEVHIPKVSYNILKMYIQAAKDSRMDCIVLSNDKLLQKVIQHCTGKTISLTNKQGKPANPSNDWAGSCFVVDGIRIIVSRPFHQLVRLPYAKFLLKWYVTKSTDKNFPKPTTPMPQDGQQWTLVTKHNVQEMYDMFTKALYIAVDIETKKKEVSELALDRLKKAGKPVDGIAAMMKMTSNSKKLKLAMPIIDMCGYCGLFKKDDGTLYSHSIVLLIEDMDDIHWMRKFNNLEAPKITQNGGYEATYFIRYNAPLHNWLCDTFHFMHCWYAELPRSLDFVSSMFLTNYQYWKDEIESQRAEYNAKDTYTTLWSWVFMVNLAPKWAHDNYLIEFRKVFPNITCGLEGFLIDEEEQSRLRTHWMEVRDTAQKSLDTVLYEGFNPNSPSQVKEILNAFSVAEYKSSDDKALRKFSEKHPLNARIAELITTVRGANKKLNTYINATDFNGRMLYEINCGGTDTGRASSKASNLWTGTQIQNIDNKLRTMFVADSGWIIANCDGSQAESRTTAYISEDATLMDTVETAPDFHTRNASLFFAIPEGDIDKPLRTLSKRVNHGSNYNMGASVLLETMGTKNVLQAKKILGLPKNYSLIKTCEYLLRTFELTYPDVKGKYYDEVIEEIRITKRLTGATGWTRYCFETPRRGGNKLVLNKYVAHPPQSLSVMLVDEAMFDFWYQYQIVENKTRIKAQVHDEVVHMTRPEHLDYLQPKLSALLARPITVKGRQLLIPNDGGSADVCWGNLKD